MTKKAPTAPAEKTEERLDRADHFEMLFLYEKLNNIVKSANEVKALVTQKEAQLREKYGLKEGDVIEGEGRIVRK